MGWSNRSGNDSHSVADLFAGVAIALLLILIVLWLQALADANEIRKLKKMKQIFDASFRHLGESDKDIKVDLERGEITLRAEQAFNSGEWSFNPDAATRDVFVRTRAKLATVLEQIEEGFRNSDVAVGLNPREHVEVLIVGHTDCKPFSRRLRRTDMTLDERNYRLDDNWDLSVLRAAALARFFTETCQSPTEDECCPDGTLACRLEERTRRIHPTWRVLPAGRSQFEPRVDGPEPPVDFLKPCDSFSGDDWLSRQRRVVVQIVPRMDKFIVREGRD